MATKTSETPIWQRKCDLIYLVFFATHLPIVLFVDIVPLYPSTLTPELLLRLRQFYISTYRDKFFEQPPAWFSMFILMELLYHIPLSVWAVGALLRDNPLVPLHLLIWGVQVSLTSLTCLVELWSWTDRTDAEKYNISTLYGGYTAFAAFITLDMFWRLRNQALRKSKME